MWIGPLKMPNGVALAPMAGVTDRPFRQLCKRLGAGFAPSEMVTADPSLRDSRKTQWRMDHAGEVAPIIVQIAGADPRELADAARFNVDHGAQVIDINMGCPAKKVCNRMAGSALLADEGLVGRILDAVVAAVDVPVTLKIRTGPEPARRNAVRVAQIAESAGILSLAVHGRTRQDMYRGKAEFDTIRQVKSAVSIPVVANGDIDSPEMALKVLDFTGADGIMIGRAAQGRPWIFREINHFLATGEHYPPPDTGEVGAIMAEHLENLYAFYGEYSGVRIARKHLGWYSRTRPDGEAWRKQVVRLSSAREQLALTRAWLAGEFHREEKAA
ncbi:tRNA dihydrouridine synthase DusB [Natronospira bacteriovora]|uniref:tRNA-dihydrouridine synthase B n=1 Tax=Natronospira bacteriovora TaxID=3069753 RepID=A0ABU0W6I7_9GAMM|nr:tRNA dihydrouridine synthase DusB [Natronospira sp. AB-CW4]MDQ2069642.1 tRNA dihydrouridine synthase DusB [Natronospira sp. AB-CW4]